MHNFWDTVDNSAWGDAALFAFGLAMMIGASLWERYRRKI